MNKKNKFYLCILWVVLCCSFFSCSEKEEEPEIPPVYAGLTDVSLKQTVNGKAAFEITGLNDALNFSSQLTFNEKTIKWSNPTLELPFSSLLVLSAGSITVVDAEAAPLTAATIAINQNTVKITFAKVNDSYSYLNSSTITVDVKTALKPSITEDELIDLNYDGLKAQSIFYGETQAQHIKSNEITIVSSINPDIFYDVKGDPRNSEYIARLNVIYFVPADKHENAGYRKRLSTLLLKHQLYICKWMKHWGYEEKSFGLPLDENGLVKIVTIRGKGNKADYPYSGGGNKMIEEINAYYAANNLTKYSEHSLVLTAINNGDNSDTPYYGLGKWCFATDAVDFAWENLQINPIDGTPIKSVGGLTNNSIGGIFHELGHALNEPHVGPSYSQKNDPAFKMTLMGAGNTTYGKTSTFLHHASAAVMNNCRISSFENRTFYETVTATVKITAVDIAGGSCTVKGSFTAPIAVTDVVVRFFNATETFLGGSSGYNCVGFVDKPAGNTFEITVPIEEMRANTYDYKVGVTMLLENGTAKSVSQPYVYRLVDKGGVYTFESEDIINDGSWTVTTSHALPVDEPISNAPGSLVDGDITTCLSMVKPGKNYNGVFVPDTDQVWATIDFGKPMTFNTIVLTNRNFQVYLNAKAVSFYGSNDGVTFTPIKIGAELPEATLNEVVLDTAVDYRYLKMTFDAWDASQGSTMQFAELGLQNNQP